MCVYLYPNADDEGVFLAAAFMTVQFVNDDLFDSAAFHKAIQASPSGKRLADDLQKLRNDPQRLAQGIMGAACIIRSPDAFEQCRELIRDLAVDPFCYEALRDLSRRMHARGRRIGQVRFERWLQSFYNAMLDFGKSHALIYDEAKVMNAEEYAEHKLLNSGMIYTVLFVELAVGYFLSDEQNQLQSVHELQHHCRKIGSLLNEIFSYEKETFREDSNNLLAILVRRDHLPLFDAARWIAAVAQRHVDEIVRIRDTIIADYAGGTKDDHTLRTYALEMDLFAAACWFWQLVGTKRYRSETSPFAELRVSPA